MENDLINLSDKNLRKYQKKNNSTKTILNRLCLTLLLINQILIEESKAFNNYFSEINITIKGNGIQTFLNEGFHSKVSEILINGYFHYSCFPFCFLLSKKLAQQLKHNRHLHCLK